jgi:hypothetical protein
MLRKIYLALVSISFCCLLYPWFLGLSTSGDLANVSGSQAQQRLNHFWPSGVQGDDLSNFYIQTRLSAESQETLMTMSCSAKVADSWRSLLLRHYEHELQELDEEMHGVVEIRTLHEVLPHPTINPVPAWWQPSGNEFTAYQAMAWFKKLSNSVSRSYSLQYDSASSKLWICLVSHHQTTLWTRGDATLLSERKKGDATEN